MGLMTLDEAEARAKELLRDLNEIELALGALSPNAPERTTLKIKKADTVARYQSAKALVKQLRRLGNGVPRSSQKAVDRAVLEELVIALNELLESDLADQLTKTQLAAITIFCDRMDVESP